MWDLERFVTSPEKPSFDAPTEEGALPFRYCWEFHGGGGILEGCRRCGVYLLRAQRCYEWFRVTPQGGEAGIFCRQSCNDCDYYRAVHSQHTNVLVLSDDADLLQALEAGAQSACFNLRTAQCGYDCSTMVSSFRPDFVFVDCRLGQREAKSLVEHLVRDPRIPFVRVVIAGYEGAFPEDCDAAIFGRIDRPFGIAEIGEFIGVQRPPGEKKSVGIS